MGVVYINRERIGTLTKDVQEYIFCYDEAYYNNPQKKAISVTLPKTQQEYHSTELFPFFFNMLSEGVNRKLQSRQLQIDENDHFSLLLATGSAETIGAVSVRLETEA
ncbi:MAG: phosphatidylinositol kinase [Bacteroidetes bacterium]|nr:phosphatidylinositol kinase [Bacteroidota bacterium]